MNITKTNIEEHHALIKLQLNKEDYEPKVNEALKTYQKKAAMPGFRPGKIPASLVKKMYGKAVLLEEINKLVSESISKYIETEKIELIGDPIPSEKEQKTLDFDNETEFEFAFEIGLSPKIDLTLDKQLEVPYYQISITNELIDDQVKYYTRRYGQNKEIEIAEATSVVYGQLEQTDADGKSIENALKNEDAKMSISVMNEEVKNKFVGANVTQIINFDIKKAFASEIEISSLLNISKDKVADIEPNFQFTINKITQFVPAEVNSEFFDKIYGEGNVKTEEEFREKIKEELIDTYSKESDYKFFIDIKDNLITKANITLPETFLKTWLKMTDKDNKITDEVLEKEYPLVTKDLTWQLIKNYIIKNNDLQVKEEELLNSAKEELTAQFIQYGLPVGSIPQEFLEKTAKERLGKEEDVRRILSKAADTKVVNWLKEAITLNNKEITVEEFNKLFA